MEFSDICRHYIHVIVFLLRLCLRLSWLDTHISIIVRLEDMTACEWRISWLTGANIVLHYRTECTHSNRGWKRQLCYDLMLYSNRNYCVMSSMFNTIPRLHDTTKQVSAGWNDNDCHTMSAFYLSIQPLIHKDDDSIHSECGSQKMAQWI